MKRSCLFILAALLLFLPSPALSQDFTPNVFAFAGMQLATRSSMANMFVSGFGVSIPLARNTRVGLTLGIEHASLPSGLDSGQQFSGPASSALLLIFLRQNLFTSKRFSTYASLGAGLRFESSSPAGDSSGSGQATSPSAAPGLVMRGAAGVSLAVVSGVRLFVEGSYLTSRATGTSETYFFRRMVQPSRFRFDLNALEIGFGIRYFF